VAGNLILSVFFCMPFFVEGECEIVCAFCWSTQSCPFAFGLYIVLDMYTRDSGEKLETWQASDQINISRLLLLLRLLSCSLAAALEQHPTAPSSASLDTALHCTWI